MRDEIRSVLLRACIARGESCGAVCVRRADIKTALCDEADEILSRELKPKVGKASTEYVNLPRRLLIAALEAAPAGSPVSEEV